MWETMDLSRSVMMKRCVKVRKGWWEEGERCCDGLRILDEVKNPGEGN